MHSRLVVRGPWSMVNVSLGKRLLFAKTVIIMGPDDPLKSTEMQEILLRTVSKVAERISRWRACRQTPVAHVVRSRHFDDCK